MSPVTRIDAIRYARHERTAGDNFNAPVDDHDLPMPLDYFVWAIHRDGAAPVVVDTGFGESAADEAYHLPEKLADTAIWRRTLDGQRAELASETDPQMALRMAANARRSLLAGLLGAAR